MKVLLDLERTIGSGLATYWKPAKRGYTQDINAAGQYPDETAEQIVQDDYDQRTIAIDTKTIENLVR